MARRPDPIEKFPRRVKQLRMQAGLSQNKLARRADLDRSTISNAERGKEVSDLTVRKLEIAFSEVLGRSINLRE